MKTRKGFVSNSSSTCYILDLCDEETEKLVKKLSHIDSLSNGFGRGTAMSIVDDVIAWVKRFISDTDDINSYGQWILNAAKQLGDKNIVLIRISDEDDGISTPIPAELIYTERDYH
jgi:hypothetical protein